jgi:tetratricopeptide (TPR) repeat protein
MHWRRDIAPGVSTASLRYAVDRALRLAFMNSFSRASMMALLLLLSACASGSRSVRGPPRGAVSDNGEGPPFSGKLLTPAAILDRLEESTVLYRFETQPKMVPLETQRNARALWPEQSIGVEIPMVSVGSDGARTVVAYEPGPVIERILREAEPLFQASDYVAAERRYEEALRLEPNDYLALLGWGDSAFFRGDPAQAVQRYERAARANPADHRSWYHRGNALLELDRGRDALDAYAMALALRPRHGPMIDGIELRARRLGVRLRGDLLFPRASVTRNPDDSITIRSVPEPHWVAYGACKALWLGEPSRRKEMTGSEEHQFSTIEELECLATLLVVYEALREKDEVEPEPALDRLGEITQAGLLDAYILYELGSRVWPHAVLIAPDSVREEVARYVRRFLLTPAPMSETTVDAGASAGAN